MASGGRKIAMENSFDAIVIGSGLGGLTAGGLYSHAGYRVLVIERNDSFGGAATTYHRGGLTIEASLHETTDPRATPDAKGEVFEALDLYKDVEFVPIEDFYEVRCPLIGSPLTIPHGIDTLAVRLAERFPDEADAIQRFLKQVRSIQEALLMLMDKHGGLWWLAHAAELPFKMWPLLRDMRSSLSDVFERYFGDNEAIKLALAANLSYYSDDPDRLWWLGYAVAQGGYLHGGGNYIKGGSQALSDVLVSRIREGGGEAIAGQTVVEILLGEEGRAAGVRYRPRGGGQDAVARAPIVFANASPHAVADMLPASDRNEFMAPYSDKALSTSLFSITLGLNRRPAELGLSAYSTILVPDWVERLSDYKHCGELMADVPSDRLPAMVVVDYSRIDSGIVEERAFPINVVGVDRLENWDALGDAEYHAKKDAWLDAIIRRLDAEWPGLEEAVIRREFATARTMRDYLNTPGGAIYGFALDAPDKIPLSGPPRSAETSVPGLWLASTYASFGGFTGAMGAGAAAAKAALRYR